jgi:hypothetical protein
MVDILRVALAKDPSERFETPQALGYAVQQARALPVPATPPLPWLPGPAAPVPLADDLAPTRRAPRQPQHVPPAYLPDTECWDNAPTIPATRLDVPPEHEWQRPATLARRPRRKYLWLLLALALVSLGITSIASGHLDQGWLYPGDANTGSQLVTATPQATIQPTASAWPTFPPPSGSTPPQPTATAQPTQTPTASPTPQPTETPTPAQTPTASPTPAASGTPTPAPTGTTAPQPTAQPPAPTVPPAPTQAPAAPPGAQPTGSPG